MANPTRWPPERRDLLVRLWEEGHDRPYIARRLGVTPNNVGRRAYMYGARRPRWYMEQLRQQLGERSMTLGVGLRSDAFSSLDPDQEAMARRLFRVLGASIRAMDDAAVPVRGPEAVEAHRRAVEASMRIVRTSDESQVLDGYAARPMR